MTTGQLFSEVYEINPARKYDYNIGFGSSIEIIENVDGFLGKKKFNLLIGAPNEKGGGGIHYVAVDKFDAIKSHLLEVIFMLVFRLNFLFEVLYILNFRSIAVMGSVWVVV